MRFLVREFVRVSAHEIEACSACGDVIARKFRAQHRQDCSAQWRPMVERLLPLVPALEALAAETGTPEAQPEAFWEPMDQEDQEAG